MNSSEIVSEPFRRRQAWDIVMTLKTRLVYVWAMTAQLLHGCLLYAASHGDDSDLDSVMLTLDGIPAEVLNRNPDLKTARWSIETARNRNF